MHDFEKAIVIFEDTINNNSVDIEIPLYISADELVKALNEAYKLNIDTKNPRNVYIQAENPIALLKGNRLLKDFGIHDGTILRFSR